MRKLISAGFTPRMIRRLDEQIEARTTAVLDAAAEAGTCNFVHDVAYQLPMHIIGDIIGIPEEDRPEVFSWAETIMAAPDPEVGISNDERIAAGIRLDQYARALGDEKRRHPTDDVWSILTTAEIEGDDGEIAGGSPLGARPVLLDPHGRRVGDDAAPSSPAGLLAFHEHPDQWQQFLADGRCSRARSRSCSGGHHPSRALPALRPATWTLDGQRIAVGDRVSLWFPAANRDPRVFDRPDEFDITREPEPTRLVRWRRRRTSASARTSHATRSKRCSSRSSPASPTWRSVGPPSYLVSAPEQAIAVALSDLPVRLAP